VRVKGKRNQYAQSIDGRIPSGNILDHVLSRKRLLRPGLRGEVKLR